MESWKLMQCLVCCATGASNELTFAGLSKTSHSRVASGTVRRIYRSKRTLHPILVHRGCSSLTDKCEKFLKICRAQVFT